MAHISPIVPVCFIHHPPIISVFLSPKLVSLIFLFQGSKSQNPITWHFFCQHHLTPKHHIISLYRHWPWHSTNTRDLDTSGPCQSHLLHLSPRWLQIDSFESKILQKLPYLANRRALLVDHPHKRPWQWGLIPQVSDISNQNRRFFLKIWRSVLQVISSDAFSTILSRWIKIHQFTIVTNEWLTKVMHQNGARSMMGLGYRPSSRFDWLAWHDRPSRSSRHFQSHFSLDGLRRCCRLGRWRWG